MGNVRAVVAVVGACFGTFLIFWQGISIADGDGVGPGYAPMYEANALMRWTLPAASLTWVLSVLPLFPVRVQHALVWTSLALTFGSAPAWLLVNVLARHGA